MEREKILLVLIAVLAVMAVVNQYKIVTAATTMYALSGDIPRTEAGYQQLLQYDKTIKLSSAQMQNYVGLDVEMPCCGFSTLQAGGNCGCGHHIALSGLAKYMASQGYGKAQIQQEIGAWKEVFYPSSTGVGAGAMGGC